MAVVAHDTAIEPPPCRTMRMVGMDGAGTRPGRVIRARHDEKSWPARASRNETLVETAAGVREPAWETGAGNLEDKVGGPRGNRRLPNGFSVN